jgi:hypothetical protein
MITPDVLEDGEEYEEVRQRGLACVEVLGVVLGVEALVRSRWAGGGFFCPPLEDLWGKRTGWGEVV